jgi:AraC-like DNA-binding protein
VLEYVERPPRPELAPHIECLWMVWDERPRERRQPDRVVPDGCPELIVHLRDPFARRSGALWRAQPRAFLAGTLTRPWLLRAGRSILTLGIRLRPGAAFRVLGFSMARTSDREVPLSAVVGTRAARSLVERVRAARTRARRFASAEGWLLERLAEAPQRPGDTRRAVALILKARGQIRIADLGRSLGWGRRRLERAFRRELGIGPKAYARIVRLNAVLATLDATEHAGVVDLALDAGYFDQAHLLRDFRSLAGRSPRTGREADGEMARHFTRPERLRALLAGD